MSKYTIPNRSGVLLSQKAWSSTTTVRQQSHIPYAVEMKTGTVLNGRGGQGHQTANWHSSEFRYVVYIYIFPIMYLQLSSGCKACKAFKSSEVLIRLRRHLYFWVL